MTYPNLYFMVDDFDEVRKSFKEIVDDLMRILFKLGFNFIQAFNEIIVNENEMVCVELVANDGQYKKVLFLGSIKYESLKRVYDAKVRA